MLEGRVIPVALVLAVFSLAQKPKNPQRIGDLSVELLSATKAQEVPNRIVGGGPVKERAPEGNHYVVIRVRVKNLHRSLAVCVRFEATLKQQFGLVGHDGFPALFPVQLVPAQEVEGELRFLLRNDVKPLEVTLEAKDSNGNSEYRQGCRSDAAPPLSLIVHSSAHFDLRGIPSADLKPSEALGF